MTSNFLLTRDLIKKRGMHTRPFRTKKLSTYNAPEKLYSLITRTAAIQKAQACTELVQCENCEKITGGWQIWGEAPRGMGFGGGCPPNRGEVWGGDCTSSPEILLTFWLKIVHFGVYSDKNSQFSIE